MAIDGRQVFALVPARGGSKGIFKKNLTIINGRPLVEFTLNAAKESEHVDRVYLSSDDQDILGVGKDMGVECLLRPDEYATDNASANDVVYDFINQYPSVSAETYLVYLQPTSPLRSALHIDDALSGMVRNGYHTLMSVVEMDKSPYKTFLINDKGQLISLFEEKLSNARRQDLPKTYVPNGAIYIFRISDFIEHRGFPSNGSMPYIMNADDSIDIDSKEHIHHVERIISERSRIK